MVLCLRRENNKRAHCLSASLHLTVVSSVPQTEQTFNPHGCT